MTYAGASRPVEILNDQQLLLLVEHNPLDLLEVLIAARRLYTFTAQLAMT